MLHFFLSMTIIIPILFLSGCGSSRDENDKVVPTSPAKVIVDGDIDMDVDSNYWSSDLQSTWIYFAGNLKNMGGKTALYPRIYFYAGTENARLENSLCPQTHLLHPGDKIPFTVEAKHLDSYNPFATADYNYYEIVWDNYEDSIDNQIIPGLTSISANAQIIQGTNNPVYDTLRIDATLKDQHGCSLPFEGIPISVDIKVIHNDYPYFEKKFGPFTNSKDIATYMENSIIYRSQIGIKLEDMGLDQYEIEDSKITIKASTPNQGTFYYETESVIKCSIFC